MTAERDARWLPKAPAGDGLPLLCFPYAGGGATVFRGWAEEMPTSVVPLGVELPGRGRRLGESPIGELEAIADAAMAALGPVLAGPVALFGHSLGALLAFALSRRLARGGRPAVHLFVAAHRAPHLPLGREPVHDLPMPELLRRLGEWGGTPAEVLNEPGLMALLEPALRADLAAAERYRIPAPEDVGCPVTAFAGTRDPLAPVSTVAAWEAYTQEGFALHRIPGEHFFLREGRQMLIQTMTSVLHPA